MFGLFQDVKWWQWIYLVPLLLLFGTYEITLKDYFDRRRARKKRIKK